MEKYSQFRDKGTGIAPFLPVPTSSSGLYLPLHLFLFVTRLCLLLPALALYFGLFCWFPIGSLGKKAALWMILGIPGIWWVDLQVDGVKKGSLGSKAAQNRLPQPSSIIASSHTSPIDPLYLAAIFDPIFTVSYPNSQLVRRTNIWESVIRALRIPRITPPAQRLSAGKPSLTTLDELLRAHPERVICVLPECTTSNGRGILMLSPSILKVPSRIKIYPVSLKYTQPDITTPVPGWREGARFLWNLCSKPTHTIRVRVAEAVYNTFDSNGDTKIPSVDGFTIRYSGFDSTISNEETAGNLSTAEDRRILDKISEALARLGRVKRVSLGVREKINFTIMWKRRRS